MKTSIDGITRLLGTSCLAAIFAAAPLSLSFDTDTGALRLEASLAQARGGDDDGRDHDRGDDHGGRGGDDDHDDDHGGRGGDDDRGGRWGDDDRDGDDRRGRGGDDDDDRDDHGRRGAHHTVGLAEGVAKLETSSEGIEVVFSDGTKVEIENGRFERKNAAGRTVEERRATQADVDRLMALR